MVFRKIAAIGYFLISGNKLKNLYFKKQSLIKDTSLIKDEKLINLQNITKVKLVESESYYHSHFMSKEEDTIFIDVEHFKENEKEGMASIYHELGHVVNKDSRNLFFYYCVRDLVFMPLLIVWSPSFLFLNLSIGSFQILECIISLRSEKRADLFAKEHGHAEGLISYLEGVQKHYIFIREKGINLLKNIKNISTFSQTDFIIILLSLFITRNGNFMLDFYHPRLTERIKYLKN